MRSLCSWRNCCACCRHPGKHPPLLQLARWQACVVPWLPKLSPTLPPLLLHPSPCTTTSHKHRKKIQESSRCKDARKGLVNSSQESQWRQNGRGGWRTTQSQHSACMQGRGAPAASYLLFPAPLFCTLSAATAMDWAGGGDSRNQGVFAATWLPTYRDTLCVALVESVGGLNFITLPGCSPLFVEADWNDTFSLNASLFAVLITPSHSLKQSKKSITSLIIIITENFTQTVYKRRLLTNHY